MEDERYQIIMERRQRIEREAIRRLQARGIVDPRLHPVGSVHDLDKWREYDVLLGEEVRKMGCATTPRI